MIVSFRFIKRNYKDSQELFPMVTKVGTGNNGHKLQLLKFYLNLRKFFLMIKNVQQWNSLAMVVVGCPVLVVFKKGLNSNIF